MTSSIDPAIPVGTASRRARAATRTSPLRVDVVSTRHDLRDFLRLPYVVYRDDPMWVAPLEREVRRTLDVRRNPHYRSASLQLMLARRDGAPSARLAITISRAHEQRWGERVAFFGFFDAIDAASARAVFAEAERTCREQGVVAIEGPFNTCHYNELGMQVDAFDQPQRFFQTHNPAWYNDLLLELGYAVSARKLTMRNPEPSDTTAVRALRAGARRSWGTLTARTLDRDRRGEDMEAIRDVFNAAFADNWHFLPSSREEFVWAASGLEYVTEPELIVIVEDAGRPVAVAVLVLDINPLLQPLNGRVRLLPLLTWQSRKRQLRGLVLYATGILPEYRNSSASLLLAYEVARVATRFDAFETTWVSEENVAALRSATHLGMRPDRHFNIYRKELKP